MSDRFKGIWSEFQENIRNLDEGASPREILDVILDWLRKYKEYFLRPPFSDYGFNRFITLDAPDYPVEISLMRGEELLFFKKLVFNQQGKDKESIARILRDTFEMLLVLEMDEKCANCGRDGLGVYLNEENAKLVYECKQCGIAKYTDGAKLDGGHYVFAKTVDLIKEKLI
ncbi:hypothetical protein F2P44_29100 [Massilia sp. CCM 8695]|uniref:Uncharacterized protein n=1 Tax=Massilia frigida TaxID=2609281 RepID=A0ABX0NIA2_9BURK|nr:hypothetical protein [Massilia frigida]NHZ83301.1 hypothetical protein [Massilia frigida]